MDLCRLISLICLCVVNGFFTLAGIFLNSVVIISLWKSSQLRRKTCYFMILALSCFDLGVVLVGHPTAILQSVAWSFNDNTAAQINNILKHIYEILQAFAFCALLTMNIDRYLAIVHPFFYQASVTKRKLMKLLLLLQLLCLVPIVMYSIQQLEKFAYVIIPLLIAIALFLLFFMNCRILLITRRKRRATHCTTKPMPVTKGKSSCLLVVACFFVCSAPLVIYKVFIAISGTIHQDFRIFWFWAVTVATMNSSLNCVIFAWRNRILYTEIKKTLTGIKTLC